MITGAPVNVLDFGAIPNVDSTEARSANDAAFAAAIASFASSADSINGANYYGLGGRIIVPFVGNGGGNFYMGNTINIDRAVTLDFESPVAGNSVGASRLVFPQNTTGIIIWDKVGSPSGFSAAGAQIINASLLGPGHATGSTGYGIEVRARSRLISCSVDGFRSDGVHINGEAGVVGNCNLFYIDGGRFMSNGGNGLFVDGPDANAGVIIGLDCSSNDGWGIYDSSFLGNTYVQAHTAANGTGSYKAEGLVNASLFLGCYSESGQNPFEFQQGTTIVGGLLAAELAPDPVYPGSAFVGGFLHSANGQSDKPAITCASDYTTGFYLQNTGLFRFSQLGNFRAQFGDYLKWSSSGTFYGLTSPMHELVQSAASQPTSIDYATSTSYTGYGKWSKTETAAGTGFNLFTGGNASATCFQVLGNGNVQNTNNSYGAISDIKFKQDIVDATSQWNDIKAVRLRKYRLKNDTSGAVQLGVIAQEIEQVSPGLIEETPDRYENGEIGVEKSKSVKYSILLLKALGALQEAMTRIEKLEKQIEGSK
jgi:hypothetical protein